MDLNLIIENEFLTPEQRSLAEWLIEPELDSLPSSATMVDVVMMLNIFPSKGQARKMDLINQYQMDTQNIPLVN
jgi:hypothetical protein